MNKTELIEALEDTHKEMIELLESLPDEVLLEPGVVGDWSIKDILSHLSYWEGQLVTLLFQTLHGTTQPGTVHFKKDVSVDELNRRWYEAGLDRPLEMVWKDFKGVRKQTLRRVSEFSDRDLADPKRYPWLEGRPLWRWIAADTFEHEEEHSDQIREWLDEREERSNGHRR
ncbi:MAG: ClbS/DfsB family four-helix bundle protein [Chloroflexi bacterium]|nr:ClbS/DfsB family four-helix bundle protein [Chloroflexota bacterium]